MSQESLIPAVLFMALVLAAALHGLAASGHFPRKHASALARGVAPIVLWGSIALVIVCLAAGTMAAVRLTPWYAAIIGGGLALLATPPVLRLFPDRFVDGPAALAAFAAAGGVAALLLIWLATANRF